MSEETLEQKDVLIASLLESVDCLREEVARVRNSNRILRRVHAALRSANAALKASVDMAQQNDDLFRRFCEGEFDAKVTRPEEVGLTQSGTQVEPLG